MPKPYRADIANIAAFAALMITSASIIACAAGFTAKQAVIEAEVIIKAANAATLAISARYVFGMEASRLFCRVAI